jgi:hypothetical protein
VPGHCPQPTVAFPDTDVLSLLSPLSTIILRQCYAQEQKQRGCRPNEQIDFRYEQLGAHKPSQKQGSKAEYQRKQNSPSWHYLLSFSGGYSPMMSRIAPSNKPIV